MPRIKLTKSAIDALPTSSSDVVYWDAAYPGFGVKITPKGRKVFIVLYRTGGAGSCLRKYTIGPTQRPVAAPFLQRGHTGSRSRAVSDAIPGSTLFFMSRLRANSCKRYCCRNWL